MAATPPPPKTPDRARLHEAALRHLARYAATEAGLTRVLDRRIDRWARAVTPDDEAVRRARDEARGVVAALVRAGVVNDALFAEARARSLTRAGRSRRAVAAHLAGKGVGRDTARDAVPDDPEQELSAALAYARRRRLGPFRAEPADDEQRRRELGALARAGFAQAVALAALRMDADEAGLRLAALRTA